VKSLKSKGKDEAFLSKVVPIVVGIFRAALEKLHAPVESPALLLKRFNEKYEARTLTEFIKGFVTPEHANAAGVKRKVVLERLELTMRTYGLYVSLHPLRFVRIPGARIARFSSLMRGGRFYVCPFFGSFLGVCEYDDLHSCNNEKFDKTVALLERAPQDHMVRVECDTSEFVGVIRLLLGNDLPIAWKSERAEHETDWQVVVEAEAKVGAKVVLRHTLHPAHPHIALLQVRLG